MDDDLRLYLIGITERLDVLLSISRGMLDLKREQLGKTTTPAFVGKRTCALCMGDPQGEAHFRKGQGHEPL